MYTFFIEYISRFNDAHFAGGTTQFGYNLGKDIHILLSQIQAYVFEFNLSHQSQKQDGDNVVIYITIYRYLYQVVKKSHWLLFIMKIAISFYSSKMNQIH